MYFLIGIGTKYCARLGAQVSKELLQTCLAHALDSRSHICALLYFQTNSFWIFVLFLCILISRLFIMLYFVIYYLKFAFSNIKQELIQVAVAANVTTHKKRFKSKR